MPSAVRRGSFIPRGAHIKGSKLQDPLLCVFSAFSEAECEFSFSYPLSRLTSLRIGGPADALALPKSREALIRLLSALHREGIPRRIIGNGTNLLAPDEGYRGVIVCTRRLHQITFGAHTVSADCGIGLPRLARLASERGIGGFSQLVGIPATLGGAIYMNAGAGGEAVGDRVLTVLAVPRDGGKPITLTRDECHFSYRKSMFSSRGLLVLSATLGGDPLPPRDLLLSAEAALAYRRATQPKGIPNAGSVFKRPKGDYAGRLIEAAGLKGYRIGGAMVSEKHAGFIVNAGGATAADFMALVEHIRITVAERFGVWLEREIEYLNEV